MIDIGADLQRAFDEGYEKGKADRPKGKWIEFEYGDGDRSYICDQCMSEFVLIDGTPADNEYNFCPHCGSRNIEEGGEEDE